MSAADSVRCIRLTVEYDGTDFEGWQVQKSARTVQGVLEEAIATMTGARARVAGAGRTDAGVHAAGQVAAFRTAARIPIVGFRRGLNALLPRDVAVIAAEEAEPDFDPRRFARGKRYRYRLWNQEHRSPRWERFAWHVRKPLELERMQAASRPLVGQHDFSAFRAADERENTVRLIRSIEVRAEGPHVLIDVEGTAFLKHMVRVIGGTLVAAGWGDLGPDDVAAILASRDRKRAGVTAPPQGLCLMEVLF